MASSSNASGSQPNLAVKAFFQSMPSPEDHHNKPWGEIQQRLATAAAEFMFTPVPRDRMSDPVYRLIQKANEACFADPKGGAILYEQLAKHALSTVDVAHDDSPMAKQLRYLRWVVNGRKDETSPFPSSARSVSAASPTHACAACGNPEATMRCSGCELPADNGKPFATVYCSQDCQRKNWKKHSAMCRQTQHLKRAVDMFDEVFRHCLAVTFSTEHTITSITADQGMVVARINSNGAFTRPSWEPSISTHGSLTIISSKPTSGPKDSSCATWGAFPTAVAPTPDLTTAVMLSSQCNTPLGDARALFEMFIRPTCRSLQKVIFVPKNMTQPVRVVWDDVDEFMALSHHEVIRATLRCGVEYAIDPTGLQMGWKHSITPWEVYSAQRIHRIESTEVVTPQPPGYTIVSSIIGQTQDIHKSQSPRAAVIETVSHAVSKLLDLRSSKCGEARIQQVLQLKPVDFAVCRANIMASFKRGIDRAVQDYKAGAKPTAVVPAHLRPMNVPLAVLMMCDLIDMLWYTEQDLAAARGDLTVVQEVVRRRLHKLLDFGPLPGIDGAE
ncbi:hypothetical protein CONLIGDRAFT_686662 [Coniochaeta ligniaria NRRL 30616]|uniref:MYND-type domain-containing protein n=1 Tax=Coniochaeta ligniaria NRRL 30616 TaxID=1408157 RepID=A0A1J7I6F5_9PEZI|nr:hypothetical protein CONLIGDRAFT_686662 [Coniochaeta ligniaria NRRL 30616]